MAINSVSITHREQMEALLTAHVGRQRVGVLVHFVRIARLVPARRRKRKFRYRVEPFFVCCFKWSLAWLAVVIVPVGLLVVRIVLDVLV